MLSLITDIALTHIAGRGRQTLVSILGVALGVGFSIAMAALMQGSQDEFVTSLIDALPHVDITDEYRDPPRQPADLVFDLAAYSNLRPREDTRGILNATEAMTALRAFVDGNAVASLKVQAVARAGGAETGITLTGTDPAREALISSFDEDMRKGKLEDLRASPFGIVIGDKLADKLTIDIGDTVVVSSTGDITRRFKVTGLFHTGVVAQDNAYGLVNLKAAQIIAGRPNAVNEIRVRLNDAQSARDVAAQIERLIGYKSVSWQEANESLLEAFFIRNIIMFTVVGAILLVAGFGIFNIVSIITHEKSRDIAILKSLGFAERDIRLIFLSEGLAMGLAGSLLGWALGFGLTKVLSSVKFEIEQATEITHLPVTFDLMHYGVAASFAIIAAATAGYLPARKASRLNPVDIIRGAT
ncbi:MAG: ABC transporter permease [Rhodobiaceae bacterium]|nr:ABC transporter permease [Rhodobiaceae bacterium]MCC0017821.1 ABC transporter permease [Rhodobiaceae bacterium]MCC0061888.1 ABC transporter permease [Rhodobiaceae bacterium]